MANVFGGGNGSCSPGSGEIISAPRPHVTSSPVNTPQPNVFRDGGSSSVNINPRDFYTKREIDKYLKSKAEKADVYPQSSLYTSSQVDQLLSALNLSSYATATSVSTQVAALRAETLLNLTENYYQRTSLYTRGEVDTLLTNLTLTGYVSLTPDSVDEVTIDPSSSTLSVSLLVKSSNNNSATEVQRWENSSTDYLAGIYADGKSKFTNRMTVGENVSEGEVAIDTSSRRIANVAAPVDRFDAVNKLYMETFIISTIDDVLQESDENYLVDALEY